jgi:hypothetical protein
MQTWNEKNMTRLWCKIVLNTSVEQIKGNEGSYSYLYPFGNLAQISFQGGLHVCIKVEKFFGNLLNCESIMN